MCDSPIKIPTRKRFVKDGDPLYYLVPCGHCESCIKLRRSEWLYRITMEWSACVRSGGCVIFDTLTYDSGHVHYLHDHLPDACKTCYDFFVQDYRDIQLFHKKLRKNKWKFRFIVVPEFGDDPRYSMRPHWHCLYFLPKGQNPILFSHAISHLWIHGFHDGINKGIQYFRDKRMFYSFTPHSNNVINYVSKYVTKSFVSDRKMRSKLEIVFKVLYGDEWKQRYSKRLQFRSLCRKCYGEHKQSDGFGSLPLDIVQEFIDKGYSTFYSTDGVHKIPFYRNLRRKYMMEVQDLDGFKALSDNSIGIDYNRRFESKRLESVRLKMQSVFLTKGINQDVTLDDAFNYLHRYDLQRVGLLFNVSSEADKEVFDHNGFTHNIVYDCLRSGEIARKLFKNEHLIKWTERIRKQFGVVVEEIFPYRLFESNMLGSSELSDRVDLLQYDIGLKKIKDYYQQLRDRYNLKIKGLLVSSI